VCHICRIIEIRCDVCSDESQNMCHKLCIPKSHKNTFEFWKIVSTFSVKAGTKRKADNRADEITLVEENDDHYDCESDVSELHMPAT
jgi:hypothetical protein